MSLKRKRDYLVETNTTTFEPYTWQERIDQSFPEESEHVVRELSTFMKRHPPYTICTDTYWISFSWFGIFDIYTDLDDAPFLLSFSFDEYYDPTEPRYGHHILPIELNYTSICEKTNKTLVKQRVSTDVASIVLDYIHLFPE